MKWSLASYADDKVRMRTAHSACHASPELRKDNRAFLTLIQAEAETIQVSHHPSLSEPHNSSWTRLKWFIFVNIRWILAPLLRDYFKCCTQIILSVISWMRTLAQTESININPLRGSSPLPCPSFLFRALWCTIEDLWPTWEYLAFLVLWIL